MNTESIGKITNHGGFSRLVRDVEQSGRPTIITRGTTTVAVLLPCPDGAESFVNDWAGAFQTFKRLSESGRTDEGFEFLLNLAMIGENAKSLLKTTFNIELPAADIRVGSQLFLNYSSEEGGSVPPMTTARADVSEVKSGGVIFTPPLLRKRGRPRKK
jgi:hypothetical protein